MDIEETTIEITIIIINDHPKKDKGQESFVIPVVNLGI
jgi:hypothetical protein